MNDDQSRIKFEVEILEALKEAVGDKLNHIVAVYLDDVPQSIQTMRSALDHLDYVTVGRLAHSLKSSSANMGLMQVASLAAKLEHDINNGLTNKKDVYAAIIALEDAFVQVRPMLINYIA